jgi:uncharacterized membrane protein
MVPEILLALVSVGLVLLFGVCVIVLPIVALVRTFQLSRRLGRIEQALQGLRQHKPHIAEAAEVREAIAEQPVYAEPPKGDIPELSLAEPQPERDHAVSGLEALVGGRALGWIAVVLLLVAAAFFMRALFERDLIGELGRVTIGIAAGLALCIAGYVFHARGWRVFSQMLTAGGVVLLYLATYATFGFYHLMPQTGAAPFLIALIIEALALAVLYESPSIALMAVIGGLLTPLLLHTDEDRYIGLFSYLTLLDAGVVALVLFRGWWASTTVALVGTHGIFWLWYIDRYHPVKLAAALVFTGAIFVLFLAHTVLSHLVRGRRAGFESLARLVLNAGLFGAAGYGLLDPDYHNWLGTAAVAVALVYAVLALVILASRPDHAPLLAVTVAVAMGFVAMVFPLQADAAWVAVGWAAQGLVLWWFGLRIRSITLRGFAAVFLALAAGRLLLIDTLAGPVHTAPFIPLLNRYGLPALAVIAALIGAAALSYRWRPRWMAPDFVAMRLLSLAGFLLLWLVLSVETYDFFMAQADRAAARAPEAFERQEQLRYWAQTGLSVVWAVFGVGTLLIGFRFVSRPLRWLALCVLALTLAKVVFVDTQALTGFYRVTVFFVLAIVMGGAAWAYQKVKRAIAIPAPERSI